MNQPALRRNGVSKILLITPFPPSRAPEADHAFRLCEHLAEAGLKVEVLTAAGSVTGRHPNVTVRPVMRDWSWRELPRLAGVLRDSQPDAILLVYLGWIYDHHPMITFAPTLAKRLLPAVPFVTLFEGAYGALVGDTFTRPVRALRALAARLAGGEQVDYNFGTLLRDSDRILTFSDDHRALLAAHFPGLPAKHLTIPVAPLIRMLTVESAQARRRGFKLLGISTDDFLIVYFGYIYPGKGIETLLKAFQLACERGDSLHLALIGGLLPDRFQDDSRSYAERLKQLARELGVAGKISWTGGFAYDSTVPSLYLRAADLCVLPFDGGVRLNHSSFATAAAHGLPVITTAVPPVPAPLIDGENVILCPPQNPALLADAIGDAIAQPLLRTRLRRGARRLAEQHFSWAKAVEVIKASFAAPLERHHPES